MIVMVRGLIEVADEVGKSLIFFTEIMVTMISRPTRLQLILKQVWYVTTESLVITAVAGFFVGAIMTVQFTLQMKEFGALGFLGGLATSATFREVGPLLIAFMLSGKIGAFTSAELGTMRVTEQIDAIRCLGANPIQEIIVPRFLGIVISSFFLLFLGLFMSIIGGMFLGFFFAGVNPEEYMRHVPTIITIPSIVGSLVKCFVFGLVLATICTQKGYFATGGAKGVGRAVVLTSVVTMIAIVVTDWLTSFIGEIILHIVRGF